MPGFDSQIFVAPDDGVGVMAFTNGTHRGPFWLPGEVGGLLDDLIGIPHRQIRTDVPQHPELWGELCGRYRVPGPLTDLRATAFLGAGLEVFVRGGRLCLRILIPGAGPAGRSRPPAPRSSSAGSGLIGPSTRTLQVPASSRHGRGASAEGRYLAPAGPATSGRSPLTGEHPIADAG